MITTISAVQPHTVARPIRTRMMFATLVCATLAVVQLSAAESPTAPSAAVTPAPAEFDLSNPEAAVKSFIAALNRSDLASAARCVRGAANASFPLLSARFEQSHPRFIISGLGVSINGEEATATIAELTVRATTASKPTPLEDRMKNEQLSLQREAGSWKIVAAAGKEFGRGARPQMLEGLATMLTLSDTERSAYAEKAEQTRCASNLKELALAIHMYARGHDGRLDLTPETALKALLPLLEGNNKLFTGVEGKSRFVFNGKLSNAKLEEITDPAATVLFYEATLGGNASNDSGALYFGYGERANVAFVDGHVQLVDRTEAAKFKWVP